MANGLRGNFIGGLGGGEPSQGPPTSGSMSADGKEIALVLYGGRHRWTLVPGLATLIALEGTGIQKPSGKPTFTASGKHLLIQSNSSAGAQLANLIATNTLHGVLGLVLPKPASGCRVQNAARCIYGARARACPAPDAGAVYGCEARVYADAKTADRGGNWRVAAQIVIRHIDLTTNRDWVIRSTPSR